MDDPVGAGVVTVGHPGFIHPDAPLETRTSQSKTLEHMLPHLHHHLHHHHHLHLHYYHEDLTVLPESRWWSGTDGVT